MRLRARLGPGPGRPRSILRSPRPQAIVTLGAAAGGVLGGWLVDRAGRKLSLLLCSAPFVGGFVVITAAQNVWMLLGGRLLTGLACGIASLVAPVSVPQAPRPGPREEQAWGRGFPWRRPSGRLAPRPPPALSSSPTPTPATGLGRSRRYPGLQMK